MQSTNCSLRYDPDIGICLLLSNVANQKPAVPMAVKTAHDLGVFARLSQTTSIITCKELAAEKGADIQLVGW